MTTVSAKTIRNFLKLVFNDPEDDEVICVARNDKHLGRGFLHVSIDDNAFCTWVKNGSKIRENWGFCIATLNGEKTSSGNFYRRAQNVVRIYAIVLDDIGTKAVAPPLKPSYKIETSHGNFQYGYLLEPTSDIEAFNILFAACADRGWTDPGMSGANRCARLPGATNFKEEANAFMSKLEIIDPVRRSIPELAEALGVDLQNDSDLLPTSEIKDPVFDWLQSEEQIIRNTGSDWYEVICPNHEHHTDRSDVVASYSPIGLGKTSLARNSRSFKCFHTHCSAIDTREFLSYVERRGGPVIDKPSVQSPVANDLLQIGEGLSDVRFLTVDEIMNRPPPKFLIDRLLPEKGVAVVAGRSGSMKSFAAIHLGLHVALGRKIGSLSVMKKPVLFMLNEGQGGIGFRLRAAMKQAEVDKLEDFMLVETAPDLMRPETLEAYFTEASNRNFSPGLIILDTFSKSTIGGEDNSTKEMAFAISTAYQMAQHFNALVVLIDHTGKDLSKGVRGAYAKQANTDAVISVDKSLGDNVRLKTTKLKEAEDNLSFDFKVELMAINGKEVPALRFREDPTKFSQSEFIMLQAQAEDFSRTEIKAKFIVCFEKTSHDPKKSFDTAFRRLQKKGLVRIENDIVKIGGNKC